MYTHLFGPLHISFWMTEWAPVEVTEGDAVFYRESGNSCFYCGVVTESTADGYDLVQCLGGKGCTEILELDSTQRYVLLLSADC